MRSFLLKVIQGIYRALRPVLFLHDSEKIHVSLTNLGESIGKCRISKSFLKSIFGAKNEALAQTKHGVLFAGPIGLAAGFDYEAKLTQILPALGFGFGTIGTITNKPYQGNPAPLLGRLVKSRSLMVNKGFKNLGARLTLKKLEGYKFEIPIGMSVGKTNTLEITTQKDAVQDIVTTFKAVESSGLPFSYYELNISCPNLQGCVEFYTSANLGDLLVAVAELKLSKPMFIKMPIEKSDDETMRMLEVVSAYPVQGVIFGNLQKNRQDPSIDQEEVKKYTRGYFSGKPTEKRSNELIRLAYNNYGKKLTIIGCGGIFSAEDAYKKIKLGAVLVQLITGMIYVGPQLPAQINLGIAELLKKDGFSHISQAVGIEA
jgi:dihydroorotate dehydrogenase subfamily 2